MSFDNFDVLDPLDPRTREMLEDRLVKGEHIVAASHISNAIYWQAIAVGAIALLMGTLFAYELMYVLVPTALIMGLYAFLRKKINMVVLTNKRILVRSGILRVDFVELRFDKIESIEGEQMITGYLMGYSNLVVMGTGNRYISIPYVANVRALKNKFSELTLVDD